MTYLERYLAGEYEEVWIELMRLGSSVHDGAVYSEAQAMEGRIV